MTTRNLWVSGNGTYCCSPKVFRVGSNAITVSLANVGPIDLLVFPTGDTDEASVVHSTLQDGSTTIVDAGTYMLDLDCEAIDGTPAPEDLALQMAIGCCAVGHSSLFDVALLEKMCKILDAENSEAGTLDGVLTEISGLCTKIATTNSQLSVVAKTLINQSERNEILMAALQETAEKQLLCFEELKEISTCAPREDLGVVSSFDSLRQ